MNIPHSVPPRGVTADLLLGLAVFSSVVARTQSASTGVITGTAKNDRTDHQRRFFLLLASFPLGASTLFAAKPATTAGRSAR
ncbi:MAG: hypothetical protein EXS40_02020 [Opitutaceae bacterium]|nr:hypothetical protein [Opitutaceae bacterium]